MPTTINDITPVFDAGLFRPAFFDSAWRWAAMLLCRNAVVEVGRRHDKRAKTVHRTTIADTRGQLSMTIPVAKPQGVEGHPRWSDIAISRHGQWWNVHRTTLESAYGRTPFFEFYIDSFAPFFSGDTPERFPSIVDMDLAADRLVARILLVDTPITTSVSPGVEARQMESIYAGQTGVDYYQVRSGKFGFIDGLSVLDLIFNMGPESAIVVRKMAHILSESLKNEINGFTIG